MAAQADLGGLGATHGLAIPWTVPAGFARPTPPVGMAYPFNPPPPSSQETKGAYWVVFTLLLALAALLVSLKQKRRQ